MNVKNSGSLPNSTDAHLVSAARSGDRKAFVEIVHRYQNLVTGVTLAILRDFALSEDAAQEAFVRAWQKINTLKDGAKLRPWLCQIARNTAVNHSKKKPSTAPLDPSLIDPSPRPDELAISRDERASLLTALDSLPEKYRLPLVLYYREEQSIQAVAKALSQSESTTRKQLSRGRKLLQKELADLMEFTLPRTAPGTIFTATVAGAIGAMLKPTAVAATAFSAEPLAASATAMTTSKLTLTTAAIITAVCLPIGYTAPTFFPQKEAPPPARIVTNPPSKAKRIIADPALSPIALEWQQLLASCQNDPKAFPGLYQTISKIPGSLRREAFHSLLLAEWVRLDPINGLTFVRSLDDSQWQQELFAKEWLKQDTNAAIDGLLSGGPGWDPVEMRHVDNVKGTRPWAWLIGQHLNFIAEKCPERLLDVINTLNIPTNAKYGFPLEDDIAPALEVYFNNDPEAAEELARSLTGRFQTLAWVGIGQARSESDLEEALAWANEFKAPAIRAELTREVVLKAGSENPLWALEFLKTLPPKFDSYGSWILRDLADQDFNAALKWVAENPHANYTSGLLRHFSNRIRTDAGQLIRDLHRSGVLKSACESIAFDQTLQEDAETQTQVWTELLKVPPNFGAAEFRARMIARVSVESPHHIMQLIDRLPDSAERDSLTQKLVENISNDFGGEPESLSEVITSSPPRWQDLLIEARNARQ